MYLLVVFLPLLNSLILSLFGYKISIKNIYTITLINIFATLFITFYIFYEVILMETPCYIKLNPWIQTNIIEISWGFIFDTLTAAMLIVILSISSCVHVYSIEYMGQDPHIKRFISYLSLFTFFMIILVSADNFLQMFLGWEGVGLCSYLLINFWFQRLQANKAALKAMIINRVGDFGLALGVFILFYFFKTVDYTLISALTPEIYQKNFIFLNLEINALNLACFFIFIGCVGKSAQIGLHTWLPDAMEGPTPVSALIHAATMVTAGIFLLARSSAIFQYTPNILFIVTILGAFTAFLAGTTGLAQNDLKRVIAYSTCSQLGYMLFVAGVSNYHVSFFHLSNHAFFKALLFLCAGSVIHALMDEQDMRKMGGLSDSLVYTCACIIIGSMALEGFPFSTGFYSKDVILELSGVFFSIESTFADWFGNFSVATTAFYSTRSLFYAFIDDPMMPKKYFMNIHESSFLMAFPLFLLSIGGLLIGYLSKDLFIGTGVNFWQNAIFIKTEEWTFFEAEFLDDFIKDIPLFFGLLGGLFASYLYSEDFLSTQWFKWKISKFGRSLYTFLNRKWFFDKIYNELVAQNVLQFAYKHTYQNIDRGIIEFLGPHGLATKFYSKTLVLNATFTNMDYIYSYVLFMLIALIAFLIAIVYWPFFILFDIKLLLLLLITVWLNI